MEYYKIEKNIVLPERFGSRRWIKIAKQMEVGDSILVKTLVEVTNFRAALVRCGFNGSRAEENGSYRVWKIAKE